MGKKRIYGLNRDQIGRLLSLGTGGDEADDEDQKTGSAPGTQPERTASLEAYVERPGSWVGRYRLLRVLGEGGMGMVFLAQQEEAIQRQVALKVIKPGMDSRRVIRRFRTERQTLALLDHPNIAHVYDAGTTDSHRPYFVMEYVKGLPITEYCDKHKLTVENRLKLFQQVCEGVQHAHHKGIIHRDLKPSNILVAIENDRPIPKIIDFGVAKALHQPLIEGTLFTEDSQLLGTPEYMSPEQADMVNEDVDTRSDIYSLGVLLYELITGILPFDTATLREGGIDRVRQMIRETDPKTPSTRLTKLGEEAKKVAERRRTEVAALAKCLRQELEWIPLKAMRKNRTERYRSASELTADIDNYLKGKPLIAGPLTAGYRLRKFARGNWAWVSGIAAGIAVLIAGVAVSTLFALQARRQARISEAVSSFLREDLIVSAGPGRRQDRDLTIRSFLDVASESLEGKFENEPLVEASIRDTIGWTYRNLDECEAAEPHLERAVYLRREHLGPKHPDTLRSVGYLAWLRCSQARYEEAAELLEQAIATCQRMGRDGQERTLDFTNTLGCVYFDLGRYDEAEQLYLESIPAARQLFGDKKDLTLFMTANLGTTYGHQGRYHEAEEQYLKTLRLREDVWDDEGMWTLMYKAALAGVFAEQQRYEEAEELYLEILPIQRRVLGDKHSHTLRSVRDLARVYTHVGRHHEAEALLDEALEETRRAQGREHRDTIQCMNAMAELYVAQRRFDDAELLLSEALEISTRTLGDKHPWTLSSMNGLAAVYQERGQYKQAQDLLLKAFHGRETRLGPQHPHTIESLKQLVSLYEAWNKSAEAAQYRARLSAP